jgi:hypothetical protein
MEENRWKLSFWKAETGGCALLLGNLYKSENVEKRRKSVKCLGLHGNDCPEGGLLGCDTM